MNSLSVRSCEKIAFATKNYRLKPVLPLQTNDFPRWDRLQPVVFSNFSQLLRERSFGLLSRDPLVGAFEVRSFRGRNADCFADVEERRHLHDKTCLERRGLGDVGNRRALESRFSLDDLQVDGGG